MKRSVMSLAVFFLAVSLGSLKAAGSDLTIGAGGRVTVELISSDAQFQNTLSVVAPGVAVAVRGCKLEAADNLTGVRLLTEKLSQRGCRVELDADPATAGVQPFPAGTTFRFNFCAQTNPDPACEFVWSSNPALNSDSFDHLRTTPIRPAEFPGQIFRLNWEDLPGGGDMDFNDLIAVVRVVQDTDGDGLWDDWERFGVDTDGDGTIDLDLPALGANPRHKDIFVEIDFMDCTTPGGDCAVGDTHSHRPKMAAINAVIQAFANAPVMNPDGMTGINLHIDISNAIPHQNLLNINGLCFAGGVGIGSFDAVKADPANFGPTNARRFAYHYALFTHRQAAGSTVSGCGELPGNDFQVSLGGWNAGAGDVDGDGLPDADVGTVQQQAGTLMHELGHGLNLRHGGGDSANNKPNYLSVMNYRFQFGIPPMDPDGGGPLVGRVDYSRAALANLDETSLTESTGIGDGTDNTRYRCPTGTVTVGTGAGSIDWNCDGDTADSGVSVDINGDGAIGTLTSFDDWINIKYDFQNTGDYDDGDHSFSERTIEIDVPASLPLTEADVSLTLTPSASSVVTGTNVAYTIRVTNNGPGTALAVVVKDNLPTTIAFVSCAATNGGACGGSGNNRTITFPALLPGTTATVTLITAVNCSVANGVMISHTATVDTGTTDPLIGNNAATVAITASNPPPVITPPSNVNAVAAAPGATSAVVNYPLPTVTDNCSGVSLSFSMPSGSLFPLGTTIVTVTATDAGGATATASFSVTVWDVGIRDDRSGDFLLFNSFTGDYLFTRCGPGGFTLAGRGRVTRVGCSTKLEDDTRVISAEIDRCPIGPRNTGNASIKHPIIGTTFLIKDSNILNNTATCP